MDQFSHRSSLGHLADPSQPVEPLDISKESQSELLSDLATMLRIRIVEDRLGELVQSHQVKTPVHLGIGQEAVAVGISRHLRASDRVFGGHRSHSHYLALGGNLDGLIAEVLCRESGVSGGRGGSMHLIDQEVGFSGSVPLVGATIPLAVGAALAAKLDGLGDIGLAYFGDGACEEGVLHEALNLSVVLHLPMVFVVENNLYSSHLDIALRQPDDQTRRFAEAHRIRNELVDGNDIIAVAGAAQRLINAARSGAGPVFLEAVTYRWRGHVGPDPNIDVGVRRSAEEVTSWRGRDPIERVRNALLAEGYVKSADLERIELLEKERVEASILAALQADFPSPKTILDFVYSS